MKILIVEDNIVLRMLYQRELVREGFEVVLAPDGPTALVKVQECQPQLVVLDIRMPGMDGIKVLERIREESPELRVILHSAYSSYRENFMTWSADAYLIKSADLAELKNTICSLANLHLPIESECREVIKYESSILA